MPLTRFAESLAAFVVSVFLAGFNTFSIALFFAVFARLRSVQSVAAISISIFGYVHVAFFAHGIYTSLQKLPTFDLLNTGDANGVSAFDLRILFALLAGIQLTFHASL